MVSSKVLKTIYWLASYIVSSMLRWLDFKNIFIWFGFSRFFAITGGSSLRKKLTKLFVDKLWAGVWKSKLRDPRLRGRTSMEKTKKCGQQEKNRTWSRVPKQLSVYRILWFNIQNVLHCLLIQRKTWEPVQKRSLWRNPDRKLWFLSFPIVDLQIYNAYCSDLNF